MRTIVAGGPRTGKTTFADALGRTTGAPVRHTDNLVGKLDWSATSAEVATWLDQPGPWIVEGVAVGRALRKWLAAHPEGKPADLIYCGVAAKVARTPGQMAMAKGCITVWAEVLPLLEARGVQVLSLP
jgi:adenylate kinase family enzyme